MCRSRDRYHIVDLWLDFFPGFLIKLYRPFHQNELNLTVSENESIEFILVGEKLIKSRRVSTFSGIKRSKWCSVKMNSKNRFNSNESNHSLLSISISQFYFNLFFSFFFFAIHSLYLRCVYVCALHHVFVCIHYFDTFYMCISTLNPRVGGCNLYFITCVICIIFIRNNNHFFPLLLSSFSFHFLLSFCFVSSAFRVHSFIILILLELLVSS